MPANADPAVLLPSASFKKSVTNVTLAMLMFIVVYLLLVLTALGIAGLFGLVGVGLIYVYPSFVTLVFGAGLVIGGLLLLYFLIKFIFKRTKTDYSGMVEISEHDQPQLFAFIRQVTVETRSPFPKRIFISPDVNAGVFYDSTFWSMFFPVKKNLYIGLGLVNALNLSEFKAVMAHEFGHFSQRSMKFGSYTYSMNRVIYNMLYDNDGYQRAIDAVSGIHSFVNLGILINIKIITGIQYILRKMYVVINRNYLSLSRQMEFHADAVAAYVTGADHIVSSLHRSEMAQLSYDNMFTYLNVLAKDKKRPGNVYPHQLSVMRLFADDHHLPVDERGVPVINKKIAALHNSQIVISDQWSSHPSLDDRAKHVMSLNLSTPVTDLPAWTLFNESEKLQAQLSDMVYQSVNEDYQLLNNDEATRLFDEQLNAYVFDKAYKGFYNARLLSEFDVDEAITQTTSENATSIDVVLNEERVNLPARIRGIEGDIATAKAISEAEHIDTFDFKGIKYTRIDAPNIEKHLTEELAEANALLERTDKELFLFFYSRSQDKEELAEAYRTFFKVQQRYNEEIEAYNQIVNTMAPVYNTMQISDIELTVDRVYVLESDLKPRLRTILADDTFKIEPADREAMEVYIEKKHFYFSGSYSETALRIFNDAVNAYRTTVEVFYFNCKKQLLDKQLNQN